MFKRRKGLAIDLGTTAIRGLSLTKTARGVGIASLSLSSIPASSEEREKAWKKTAQSLIKETGATHIVISLPGRGVLVRFISLPPVASGKIESILQYEVQHQLPFPLDAVVWSYQILSQEEKINLLVGAVKKDMVNNLLNLFTGLGVRIDFIDSDTFALLNALRFSPDFERDKTIAFLEIGAESSNLLICYNEQMLVRSLTISGNALTTAIEEVSKIEFSEAEEKKIKEGEAQFPTLSPVLENLITEVQNSIDYWRFTQKGPEIKKFLLTGGSSKLAGLKDFFTEKLRVETISFNPFANISYSSQFKEVVEKESSRLAVAVGLALRQI
ncbi:MAG: type IV pilus assembly protein PilM [Candidatus Omnitrophica bacterium]|nr:type IV pilus assembly protein PilM [Candidatus Omnitrophota bacterium]